MNLFASPLKTLAAVAHFLLNKMFAILLLIAGTHLYNKIPDGPGTPTQPFAEVIYALILLGYILIAGPFARLLIFPEAAEYAESGQMRKDLYLERPTQALAHYRFATAVCYIAAIVCVGLIQK